MASSIFNTAAFFMSQNLALVLMIDLQIKSTLVLAAFLMLALITRKRITDSRRHLLYLNGFFCLALLPLLPNLAEILSSAPHPEPAIFELTLVPGAQASHTSIDWSTILVALYLLPVTLLLYRLRIGLLRLRELRKRSTMTSSPTWLAQLENARERLGISRRIILRVSASVNSPLSFGWLSPQVILPQQALSWPPAVINDVLLHELSHIRRLDWLSMMFAYLVASLYWINPLVWLLLKKLNEEAETACDATVVHAGRDSTDYAQSLLSVARACVHGGRHPKLLTQTMLDRSTLETRITLLLEKQIMRTIDLRKEFRITAVALMLISAALLTVIGSTRVVSAQSAAEDNAQSRPPPATRSSTQGVVEDTLRVLNAPEPRYPTIAAEQGIEGWVQMMFTVSASGLIDIDSATIVDAEPPEVFNASALGVLPQFRFSPRMSEGQAVDVPGVQYVFRYLLDNE